MDKLSLRERKKIQTRERILQAAEELVSINGYPSVTIASICEKADIAPRTFFAYFPSKEAVFFYDKQLMLNDLAEKLNNRPNGQTIFQTLRELFISKIDSFMSDTKDGFNKVHHPIECDNAQFQMYGDHVNQQFEDILRENIAKDLNQSPDDLGPMLAAASTNSTLGTIMSQIATNKNGAKSKEEVLEILDKTLSFLEAGITALDNPKRKL